MGQCFETLQRKADAVRAYERACGTADRDPQTYHRLADLYKQLGNRAKAAEHYQNHVELNEEEVRAPAPTQTRRARPSPPSPLSFRADSSSCSLLFRCARDRRAWPTRRRPKRRGSTSPSGSRTRATSTPPRNDSAARQQVQRTFEDRVLLLVEGGSQTCPCLEAESRKAKSRKRLYVCV